MSRLLFILFSFITVIPFGKQMHFVHLDSNVGIPQLAITQICQDTEGNIWIASDEGALVCYDGYDCRRRERFNYVYGLYALKEGGVVVITDSASLGLKVDGPIDTLVYEKHKLPLLPELKSIVRDTVRCPDGSFWVGTEGAGVFHCDHSGNVIDKYGIDEGLSSNFVHSLCWCTSTELWIGTQMGLNVLNTENGKINVYLNQLDNPASLSHNTVRKIFRDSQGGMWVGTYYGGISYWHPSRKRISTIIPGSEGNLYLNDIVTGGLIQTKDGRIWIGTNKGGLNCIDPKFNKISRYYIPDTDGKGRAPYNDIKTLWAHPDGQRLYIGSHGSGLSVMNLRTSEIRRLNTCKFAYDLVPVGDDRHLLIGTIRGEGKIWIFDCETDKSEPLVDKCFRILGKDAYGRFWAGPKLSSFNIGKSGEVCDFKVWNNIYGKVRTGHLDASGNFWVGGDCGLCCVQTDTVKVVLSPDSIPSISGIEEDSLGYLWIPTDDGLFRFDRKHSLEHFSVVDGLSSNYFTSYSHCTLSDGRLCFGGYGGVSILNPFDFTVKEDPCPAPSVTSITASLLNREYLAVRRPDSRISFKFSAHDYRSVQGNSFQYCLEGFDNGWQDALGGSRTALYTALPRGNYKFRVRITRGGDEWTEMVEPLCLRVFPPWYFSIVAIIVWCLLAGLSIFYSIRFIYKRKMLLSKLRIIELEEANDKNKNKLRALKFLNTSIGSFSTTDVVGDISSKDAQFLSRVLEIVETNISNVDFTIDDIASALGMSRMTLHTRIKMLTGNSTLSLVHKVRFLEACRLLSTTNLNVAEISYKVGARSPASFGAAFKHYFNCTPHEWAETHSF